MNCFKLAKSVLDEHREIPGKDSEEDKAIQEGLGCPEQS
jgi:hypothetical protein